MRIAHLANFYGPTSGGLRTAMHALGAGYQARGHDVLLIVPGETDAVEVTGMGTRVSVRSPRLPFSGGYRIILRRGAVRRALARFGPDAVEISDRTTLVALARWARRRAIPTVFFAHERADGILRAQLPRWVHRLIPTAALARRHHRRLSRLFTTIVATTDYAAQEWTGIHADHRIVPLGVDLDTFHPNRAAPDSRAQWAAPHEHLVVMASRLSPEKRPDLAIDAIAHLAARGVPVRLVSAGTGSIDQRVRERARGLPVTFLGHVADRAAYAQLLATADVLVAPGPIETFGLAALEGLASGTPAVVNAASALPSVVGDAGLAAAGTPAHVAGAISDVLSWDPAERRARARARAELFPWSATVDAMEALHAGARRPHTAQQRGR